jgi:hypothetical protein
MALKIKQLLYKEMFTIAGARKKLQSDARGGSSRFATETKPSASASPKTELVEAPMLFDAGFERESGNSPAKSKAPQIELGGDQREVLKTIASHLLELREMLKSNQQ